MEVTTRGSWLPYWTWHAAEQVTEGKVGLNQGVHSGHGDHRSLSLLNFSRRTLALAQTVVGSTLDIVRGDGCIEV